MISEPSDLERCTFCDALFDPAELHEVIRHATGECVKGDENRHARIRGELIEEPPQG